MHDRLEKTYQTTAAVIDAIRAKGLEFVTVSEILDLPKQVVTPQTTNAGDAPVANTAPSRAPLPEVPASVVTAPHSAAP